MHNMTQRFEKAYNALLKAFMDDTLAKGTCTACAVGNIVADAMGAKVYLQQTDSFIGFSCSNDNDWWKEMFITGNNGQRIYTIKDNPHVRGYRQKIEELTGYTWRELARVEKVFEETTKIVYHEYCSYTPEEIMEDQFNGLMAVMDVLIELDNIEEGNKCKEAFKNKFATLKINLL